MVRHDQRCWSLVAIIAPNFVVRVDPAAADLARAAARASGKRVGHWVEEAIREKVEREGNK